MGGRKNARACCERTPETVESELVETRVEPGENAGEGACRLEAWQLRDKIGVASDLGRAIEVGFDFVYTVSAGVEFVRVLKAGFGRAVEVKFDCTSKSDLGH